MGNILPVKFSWKSTEKVPTRVQDSEPNSSENPSIKPQLPHAFKSPQVLAFNSQEYTFVLSVEQVVSFVAFSSSLCVLL